MNVREPVADVTVVVPFRSGGDERWLEQATGGFPVGQKLVVVDNDGDMAAGLNDAIGNHVGTDWVYRFDADDVPTPGLLHRLRDAVWDGSDVAYPTMILSSQDTLEPVGLLHADMFCPRRLETHNYVTGASLFRRALFVEVGGYRELAALEDWDLWLRMARAGGRFKPVPDAVFHYRQTAGSRNKITPRLAARLAAEIAGEDPAGDCVATFYYQGTPYTAHLRCVNPARYLPAVCQPVYHVPVEEHPEQPAFRYPHHRGVAVFQFGANQADALHMRWLQMNGHPVFLEVDDNYTVDAGEITRRAGWQRKVLEAGKPLSAQQPSVEGHRRLVRMADGVICATDYLAGVYRELNPNVHVCPNQVEPDEWPPLRKPADGVFRVGWFASGSHRHDYPLVRKALAWAAAQPRVEVLIMGLELDDGRVPHRFIPWCDDWGVYRLALLQLDVGLAPVVPTPWSLGRSDVKALDYAMGGACPVLQDELPYAGWQSGVTCLKAKTPDDWLRAVKRLVYERPLARSLAARARAYALEERTFEENVGLWRRALGSAQRTALAA